MEYLEPELEKTLKRISEFEHIPDNRDLICQGIKHGVERVSTLARRGYAAFSDADASPGAMGDSLHVERTVLGRGYFALKWRHRFDLWAPVLASGIVGGAFSLIGVLIGLLI